MASCRSTSAQVAKEAGQVHFRVPGLKAVLHRGADLRLGLRATHSLAEQVGIAMEILNGRERDRVDTVLDHVSQPEAVAGIIKKAAAEVGSAAA